MSRYLQDILDQPDQLLQSLQHSVDKGSGALKKSAGLITGAKNVFITAIGASWSAGIAIQAAFNEAGVQAVLCDAADFLYFTRIPPDSAVLFLSRSGKSVELVQALPKCKLAKAAVISITNAADSPLAESSDACLLTSVRFDHSISVSTYSSIILTGLLLTQYFRPQSPGLLIYDELMESLREVNGRLKEWQDIIETTSWPEKNGHTYFTARGASLASAHESMLLWEEVAKQPAAALTTGAFRHGPQEIIDNPLNMAVWLENNIARDHDVKLINDLVGKKVNVLSIGQELPGRLKGHTVYVPSCPWLFSPVINIIPLQLAAEKLARMKGIDPDVFLYCNFIVESEGGL
ncbi:SIS domain-containing protein [Chitinophaga barathri]|uniref:Glutamine--fructose-6-phosphate aminotransferase [isomerizing] n=1 Tax=Chitinophaga barathri TaxID=1647451 RepID=A0A3N4MGN8_9BACT|nr:SIS domain-containing protein [Chitinophaga barathri]RPD42595.1 SIS domain-containing protein [Chitinophaga barathri]